MQESMLSIITADRYADTREKLYLFGGYLCALMLLGVYCSTALTVIASVVILLVWLSLGKSASLIEAVQRQPVALWALLLYGVLLAGLLYGNASHAEALDTLKKYRELLLIPVLIPFLDRASTREWIWRVLIAVSLLSILVAALTQFGLLPSNDAGEVLGKSRITHSILIAFFGYYCLHKAVDEPERRWAYFVGAALAIYDVFFLVQGRTGQLILLALLLLFIWQRFEARARVLLVVAAVAMAGAYVQFSDKADRIREGIEDTVAFARSLTPQASTSMGQRYTFWTRSISLVAEKPLLGHGTGSFAREYARVASRDGMQTSNPHSELLMIAVNVGLVGLVVYLGFLYALIRSARMLSDVPRRLAVGLIVTLVVGSVFNSPLYDHAEGHWFALMIALCCVSRDQRFQTG